MSGCLKHHQLRFITDPLTRLLWQYLFPIQLTLGVLGNCLNLWVLASDEVPNIASDLLAAVSFCDLAFLISMIPHSLSSFDALAYSYNFRYFYLKFKLHIAAIANWMSAAAIWLILAVSIERFLIIRQPLRSKLYWQRGRMVLVLSSIFFATGLLTLYHHFEYDCTITSTCNGTQLFDFCYYSGSMHPRTFDKKDDLILPSDAKKIYMRVSTIFNAVLVVFIPIMVVIMINMLMIRELRSADLALVEIEAIRGALVRNQHRQRRKVTITVIAIGLCFSLTQGPSAVMAVYELLEGVGHLGTTFYRINSIANSLVVTGKTINFMLFCLSSEHFRRKCFVIFARKFPKLSQSALGNWLSVYSRTTAANSLAEQRGSLRTIRSRRDSGMTNYRESGAASIFRDSTILVNGRDSTDQQQELITKQGDNL